MLVLILTITKSILGINSMIAVLNLLIDLSLKKDGNSYAIA